ncbi:hypothetical protein AMAG_19986 [Allomyces macrogynus ATCC 38327]|uniref:Uncharacterized protein n=1 Tax=Allomyces macrogynus (strain ATCC 38327) TaxID=578462 RepID=A0A0L0T3Z3_ALLM3|nr:hypothetical protein AMAG_19986 [Allomyces macrogynus ATCC 38327]|eukprot:KNE69518.1 hypothetical protein AMAG_19986 [Allomyces macrogynus ATCC 38327]
MISESRLADLRARLITAIQSGGQVNAIILSGGLDTSILAEVGKDLVGLKYAVTVLTSPDATDAPYATAIAKKLGLEHIVIRYDSPLELIGEKEVLDFAVETLCTFDPMDDGADEIFAGYSFVRSKSNDDLKAYIRHLTTIWRFSAGPLAAKLNIRVVQPYMDAQVVGFALSCDRPDLINMHDGAEHGKYCLRMAFPWVHSAWRGKDPIEVGAGTTVLPKLLAASTPTADLERGIRDAKNQYGITIRDAEHLLYFQHFRAIFLDRPHAPAPETTTELTELTEADARTRRVLPVRHGSDPCRECAYQLQAPTQMFCVVCGAWPARDVPVAKA